MVGGSAGCPWCDDRLPPSHHEPCLFSAAPPSYRCMGSAIMCWYCISRGGSVDPPSTAVLASLPASLGLAVGPEFVSGRAATAGYTGPGDVEGGGGGTRLVLIPYCCASMASAKSIMARRQ